MNINYLFKLYYKTDSFVIKNEIVKNFMHLPAEVALGLSSTNRYNFVADFDDLVSYGLMGLEEAVDKFDLYRKTPFQIFAKKVIRNKIMDCIRSFDKGAQTVSVGDSYFEVTRQEKTPEELYIEQELSFLVNNAVNSLNSKERRCIQILFLEEKGDLSKAVKELKITPQAIYQIRNKAFCNLRNMLSKELLR